MNYFWQDELTEWLAPTEDLNSVTLKMDGSKGVAVFAFGPGWNVGLKDVDPQDSVNVEMHYEDINYTLSKEAVLSTAHAVGLPPTYVARTPGVLIATHLNYWSKNMPDTDLKLLTVHNDGKHKVLTATKGGIVPFSNIDLVHAAEETMLEAGLVSIAYDSNSFHGIHSTGVRLVSTQAAHTIGPYDWSVGLQVMNSITGKHPLSVGLYLRNNATGGGLVHYGALSKYNRKTMGQDESEVLEWLKKSAKELLKDAKHEFEILESLKEESISDAVAPVLMDIFKTYKVPLKVRQTVMDSLIASEDLTYYGVVNALVESSTVDGLPDHYRTSIMEIAGAVMHDVSHRCNSCKKVI